MLVTPLHNRFCNQTKSLETVEMLGLKHISIVMNPKPLRIKCVTIKRTRNAK